MPAGRPTDYNPSLLPKLRELAAGGGTDMEVAELFGVSVTTVYRWKNTIPEFRKALKDEKDTADERVVKKLYQKALEGDTTSMIFWLKNRKPEQWRDRQNIALAGADGESPIQIVSSIPRPPKE